MSESIIFIHGLWMNGLEMKILAKRFEKSGYATSTFKYSSTEQSPTHNANLLSDFVEKLNTNSTHYICHSLGGLVLRHHLSNNKKDNTGRVVMLGTPNTTSRAAKSLINWPMGTAMLGKSTENGLLGPLPDWQASNELGVIAGNMRLGLGMLIPDIPVPNDGTVGVEETHLDGMNDHITLHVSHFGMLISNETFKQAKHFIENGVFLHK